MNPRTAEPLEWTRFFPAKGTSLPDVLHARFVRHAYSRITHDAATGGQDLSKLACSVSTLNAAFITAPQARSS